MPADHDATANPGFAAALGARLRAVRLQQHLSLHGVERKSGGRWKAVVVGSYERGDRAVTVQRLADLAEFYGVPITELLPRRNPGPRSPSGGAPLTRVVLNLDRLDALDDPQAGVLRRFARSIQRQRGGTRVRSLPLRLDDLKTLALMHDLSVEAMTDRLVRLQVLCPESLIVDHDE
jgi:transcriptional regulator with XRE-family HTH domain